MANSKSSKPQSTGDVTTSQASQVGTHTEGHRTPSLYAYRVGNLYIPGHTRWPEHTDYNYRNGAHELRLFWPGLSAAEIKSIRSGKAEFALVVEEGVIFFLYKFDPAIPWSDATYSIHLVPDTERRLPAQLMASQHALLHIVLVNGSNGRIEALRAVTLSA